MVYILMSIYCWKRKKIKNQLGLSEVDEVGKIWDKHRANADRVSNHYDSANEVVSNDMHGD